MPLDLSLYLKKTHNVHVDQFIHLQMFLKDKVCASQTVLLRYDNLKLLNVRASFVG